MLESNAHANAAQVSALPSGLSPEYDQLPHQPPSSANHSAQTSAFARKGEYRNTSATTPLKQARENGYLPIEDYALIGNMRTAALVSKDCSIDSFCFPHFDSPSVFCRILDKDIGGHWQIAPRVDGANARQHYLPSTAIVITKWLHDLGVTNVIDYMPRPRPSLTSRVRPLYQYVIRRVECVRGKLPMRMECFPSFNYARDSHTTQVQADGRRATFESKDLSLELLSIVHDADADTAPLDNFKLVEDSTRPRALGPGAVADFELTEGQIVTFVLRQPVKPEAEIEEIANRSVDAILNDTSAWWTGWVSTSKYSGRWREFMQRSAITLKLLTFEPTGAIVAAATFSLPEALGGVRQWDYRYTWLRDASFTIYALIRLGYTKEADAYMDFIKDRIQEKGDKDLQIMYTIHGGRDIPEIELTHLSGYRDSKPVRIGNGASDHLQLDVYGELLDSLYLHQKFSKPMTWDFWVSVRQLVDRVVEIYDQPDMSIWEVRSQKQNYLYSKVMCWVALNRGLRLADKRSLPCPNRMKWLETQDKIYEEIMTKGWNEEKKHFSQSYESPDVLDSSCLIMALCFFISPADPRFISTIKQILKTPEKGGLTANSLVFRYDVSKAQDGVGGDEGTFTMCTLWAIEALARCGQYSGDGNGSEMIKQAVRMFEELLSYGNHVQLYAEEISASGEALGNVPQAFTHVSAISCAFNLNRVLDKQRVGE